MLIHPFFSRIYLNKALNRYYLVKKSIYRYFLPLIKLRISKIVRANQKHIYIQDFPLGSLNYNRQIIELADHICEGYIDIFSIGERKINKIDWHLDYRSNFKWPKNKFHTRYSIVDMENNADVKIPWENSRSHHYLYLGQAYLMTNDEKYTNIFLEHITDWIAENPFMKSINWCSTMEVSIRAVNWQYALRMFNNSPLLTKTIRHNIIISLYQHGYYIFRHPEKSVSNNHNHYLSDLAGQIHLGIFFKGFSEATLWLNEGINEFFREIRTQILPTGPTYERSINYHRLVTEIISYTIILLENSKHEIPLDIKFRVEKMFEFIMYYIRPDGTCPIIGDQDDGRFLPFSLTQNLDHRYLLAIAGNYFNRQDFYTSTNTYYSELFFLFNGKLDKQLHQNRQKGINLDSKGFKDAGFFIMRKKNNYMFIVNSGKGRYSEVPAGTHTHSDLLSFDLMVQNVPFIVDSGTYLYSASPKERKLYRSTAMHNTVVIDDQDQNNLKEDSLWTFDRNAIPKLLIWEVSQNFDIFEGEHSGYLRLDKPLIHRRKVFFDKTENIWELTDFFIGNGDHDVKLYYNFDVDVALKLIGDVLYAKSQGVTISIKSSNPDFNIVIEDSYISKSYGKKLKSKRAYFNTRSIINKSFVTTITQL